MIETKVPIQGIAITPGVSRNGINYTTEELIKFAPTLIGRPILKDHESKTDNVIGLITHAYPDAEGKVHYEGWIKEDGTKLIEKVKDERIKEVSIGAGVERLVKEQDDDEYYTAIGMFGMELSTTPTPGCRGTSLKKSIETFNSTGKKIAVSEKISEIKKLEETSVDKLEEEVTMAEEEKPVEQPKEEAKEEPVEQPAEETKEEPKEETTESKKIELDIDSSKIDEAIKKVEKLIEMKQKLKESEEEKPAEEPKEEETKEEPKEEETKEDPKEEETKEEPAEEPKEDRSEEKMSTKGKVGKEDMAEARESVAGDYVLERSEFGEGYALFKNPNGNGHYK